jgi:hypothetical protein
MAPLGQFAAAHSLMAGIAVRYGHELHGVSQAREFSRGTRRA